MLSSPFSPVAFVHYRFVSFGVRCTLFAIHCAHFADDSMLRAPSVLLFAFGYWLFASRCSIFVFRCLALVSRLLAAHYLQNPARSCLLATHGQLSLLSSRLMSSADCCKSLRIDHPCWRCVIRFLTRKYPPHWCSSLAAVCLLFISQHANHLLHLVSRCSQIPLFEICCFLLADSFALLSSCSSLLFASHSVLGTRILLLADCCFLF